MAGIGVAETGVGPAPRLVPSSAQSGRSTLARAMTTQHVPPNARRQQTEVQQHRDPAVACRTHVDAANTAGGEDNAMATVVDCEGPASDVHDVGAATSAGRA